MIQPTTLGPLSISDVMGFLVQPVAQRYLPTPSWPFPPHCQSEGSHRTSWLCREKPCCIFILFWRLESAQVRVPPGLGSNYSTEGPPPPTVLHRRRCDTHPGCRSNSHQGHPKKTSKCPVSTWHQDDMIKCTSSHCPNHRHNCLNGRNLGT